MSAEEDLLQEVWRRWNAGDREPDPALFDEEIEIQSAMTGSTFRGRDGVAAWTSEIDEQFERWDIVLEAVEVLAHGRVLGTGRILAEGRGSGVSLDQEAGWLVDLRDGRVLRIQTFIDQEAARAAARKEPG
jgi:ketosteroid isomerase-like protein